MSSLSQNGESNKDKNEFEHNLISTLSVEIFPFWSLVERVLTGKILTGKLPTGKFSTDKVL
jgi:membrane-associated protease RseP (regulator of RpoE activity)